MGCKKNRLFLSPYNYNTNANSFIVSSSGSFNNNNVNNTNGVRPSISSNIQGGKLKIHNYGYNRIFLNKRGNKSIPWFYTKKAVGINGLVM